MPALLHIKTTIMNILIIGASSGVGKEIAKKLSDQNHQIYTAQRSTTANENNFQEFDVLSNNLDLAMLPEEIDGLVYCPGTINLKPFNRLTIDDFYTDWQINFLGAVKVIQTVLPRLKKAKGSIVLFSSVAAQTGMSFHASIASSKAAVEGLTYSLAAEFAPLVRVNSIAPSLTETPLANKLLSDENKKEAASKRHPLQKFGHVNDMAAMACFLLSNDATFITGQVIKVDGGLSNIR
jgi:NAD(P)-dependent dehydrogenase (short-subunit alcohol dehydrogenase family)